MSRNMAQVCYDGTGSSSPFFLCDGPAVVKLAGNEREHAAVFMSHFESGSYIHVGHWNIRTDTKASARPDVDPDCSLHAARQ